MLCDRMGIDIWEVVDAAATKPYGFMRFDPGPGMGGHCLPVDPFYLSWKAREYGQPTEFVELAGEVNQRMPEFCVERIARALNDHSKPVRGSRIAILGVSYKPGVGDLRESPALKIMRPARRARAPTSSTTTTTCPSCPSFELSSEPLEAALDEADCAVIVTAHPGPRRRGGGARRAAGGRLPRRDARHRGAEPGAPVSGPVRVGVVGPRLLGPQPGPQLRPPARRRAAWICDGSAEVLERGGRRVPRGARAAADLDELLADPRARRRGDRHARAHPRRARRAACWRPGKHCFVEKPLAQSAADAERVVEAARGRGPRADGRPPARVPPGPRAAEARSPRPASSATSTTSTATASTSASCAPRRTRSGASARTTCRWCCGWRARSRTSAPRSASPTCATGVEDVVFCFLRFPSGLAAHLHLSWLDPHKERRFTVVGSKKMATFDDMELERKLTVYDKGFDEDFSSYGEYIARSGDVYSPRVPNDEPLRIECAPLRGLRARRARRRARTARAGCGWCGCSRSCSARSTGAAVLRPSDRAPGLLLGEGVALPPTVELGGNVVIHEGTVIGGGGPDPGRRDRRQAAGARARVHAPRASPAARRDRRGRHGLRRRGGGGRAPDRRRGGGRRPGARARARGGRRGAAWWAAARRWTTT